MDFLVNILAPHCVSLYGRNKIDLMKKLKILDALRRQLDFVQPNTKHNPNTWWDEFMDLNNELRMI